MPLSNYVHYLDSFLRSLRPNDWDRKEYNDYSLTNYTILSKLNRRSKLTIDSELSMLRIHIAPVGFEVDRIVLPAISMKADKVWLLLHNDNTDDLGRSFSNSICERLSEAGIEYGLEHADRTQLFDTLRALRIIILNEKRNAIFVNASVGSKIQAIACMMACMMFKDDVNIKPYYAVPQKYETVPKEQETVGLEKIVTLPEYKIEIPPRNLIRCLEIIHQRINNTITKKELRDEALAENLIRIERLENKEQSAYMALKNNLLDPLLLKWKFIRIEKVGRRHNISLTEEGLNALTFLSPD